MRQGIGRRGEELAARFLRQQGYAIVAMNVRTPHGELAILGGASEDRLPTQVRTAAVQLRTQNSGRAGGSPLQVTRHSSLWARPASGYPGLAPTSRSSLVKRR